MWADSDFDNFGVEVCVVVPKNRFCMLVITLRTFMVARMCRYLIVGTHFISLKYMSWLWSLWCLHIDNFEVCERLRPFCWHTCLFFGLHVCTSTLLSAYMWWIWCWNAESMHSCLHISKVAFWVLAMSSCNGQDLRLWARRGILSAVIADSWEKVALPGEGGARDLLLHMEEVEKVGRDRPFPSCRVALKMIPVGRVLPLSTLEEYKNALGFLSPGRIPAPGIFSAEQSRFSRSNIHAGTAKWGFPQTQTMQRVLRQNVCTTHCFSSTLPASITPQSSLLWTQLDFSLNLPSPGLEI